MKHSLHVRILGHDYPLRVKEGEEEIMREIVAYVNQRMQVLQAQLPDRPELTVAVIAALSIAEEFFKLRRQTTLTPEALAAALADLSTQLDDAISTSGR